MRNNLLSKNIDKKNTYINNDGAIKSAILFIMYTKLLVFNSKTNAMILNNMKYDINIHKLQLNNVAISSFETFFIK